MRAHIYELIRGMHSQTQSLSTNESKPLREIPSISSRKPSFHQAKPHDHKARLFRVCKSSYVDLKPAFSQSRETLSCH